MTRIGMERASLDGILALMERKKEPVALTRHGKAVAVVMSAEDYARLCALREDREDAAEALESLDEEGGSTLDALRVKYGLA